MTCAATRGQRPSLTGAFLPWVLPGMLVSWVFPGKGGVHERPLGRHWSSLAAVERPRTAQRRPRQRPGGGLRTDGQLPRLLACLGPSLLQATMKRVVAVLVEVQREVELGDEL